MINKFDYNKIIRNTVIGPKTVEIANLIMANQFYFDASFDVIDFGKKIKWNYKHTKSANTYQIYLHTLSVISYLCDGYLETKDKKYLKKALAILQDWSKYNKLYCLVKKNYVWSDHAASFRVSNILYFYLVAYSKIKIDEKFIYQLLLEHLEFLANFKYYSLDNHGIMIDKTLINISFAIKDPVVSKYYFNKGYYRIREAFYRDYSRRNVHLENSPDYHCMVKRYFNEVQALLKNFHLSLGEDIEYFLNSEDIYVSLLEKPNCYFPMVGDSNRTFVKNVTKNFDDFLDRDAGIAILQKKDNNDIMKSNYVAFICGYQSLTHKHCDDLSIELYSNGTDIFVDSGKYNYDRKDPIRNYMKSPYAHNTVIIDSEYCLYENYEREKKPIIKNFNCNEDYKLVSGINTSYKDGAIERTIILFEKIIIIYDYIKLSKKHSVYLNFNLSPLLDIISSDKNQITIGDENHTFLMKQYKQDFECKIVNQDYKEFKPVISEAFTKLTPIKKIVFENNNDNLRKESLIVMKLKDCNFDILNDNAQDLNIKIDQKEYMFHHFFKNDL